MLNKYEFFSPGEVIKKYFEEFGGSLQNRSHSKSLEYARKVEKLREHFASFLGIKDTHLVSFQFNQYYINRLIFSHLRIDSTWTIYSDNFELKPEFPENNIYPLNTLLEQDVSISNSKKLIWIGNLKNINLELFEAVGKLKSKSDCNSCYIFLSLNHLLYDSPNISYFLRECSFLAFNPSEIFKEFGVVFFAFKKGIELKPIFMGSGAAKFNRETKNIEIRELPYSLEIGTQNVISLIILERLFYFLNTETSQILSRLKDTSLNFNLIENLNTK